MFYKYEIRNNGIEDILYLYLSMKYEFSKEIFSNQKDVERRAKNFIQTNHIPFRGKKVYLIIDGIVVKSLDISNVPNSISVSPSYSCDSFLVSIQLEDQSFCEISLREFLLSVLFANYQDSIQEEVLKAICVLFNGYAYKRMKEDHYISSSNDFVNYKPLSFYRSIFSNYQEIFSLLNTIISSVDGVFLAYEKNYILPFIHYSNSGKTLTNSKYPYLSSVKSLWDMASPYYIEIHDYSFEELNTIFSLSLNKNSNFQVLSKDNSRRIALDNHLYTIEEFKNILNLKSTDLYLIVYQNFLRILTKGFGNSYGLSIYGANEIAKSGTNYSSILNYYFPKTRIFKYIKELS